MANRVKFSVSVSPIETLTDANSGTHDIQASEVYKTLSGSGESLDLTAYNQTAAVQGYLNTTVNYAEATHSAGGTLLTSLATADFIFIKNTGYKFSSVTALGAATTDCVIVVVKTAGYGNGTQDGWYTSLDASEDHFFEIAFLKPGMGIPIPLGASNKSITQFGSNANDLTNMGSTGQTGQARFYVKTVVAAGTAAASANAVEFLAVT